jgi:diadenosine tetraphosphate (Ap4A) HIT family hydrolase
MQAGCYTCKPKGRIGELIIASLPSGRFNFDLKNRPLLIFTTARHWPSVHDMPADDLKNCFEEIDRFMARIGLMDYQILINFGRWANHQHAHLKIKADEQSISTLRFDHLARRSGMWNGGGYRVCDGYQDGGDGASTDVRDVPEHHASAAAAGEQACEEVAGTVVGVEPLGTKVYGVHEEGHCECVDGNSEND